MNSKLEGGGSPARMARGDEHGHSGTEGTAAALQAQRRREQVRRAAQRARDKRRAAAAALRAANAKLADGNGALERELVAAVAAVAAEAAARGAESPLERHWLEPPTSVESEDDDGVLLRRRRCAAASTPVSDDGAAAPTPLLDSGDALSRDDNTSLRALLLEYAAFRALVVSVAAPFTFVAGSWRVNRTLAVRAVDACRFEAMRIMREFAAAPRAATFDVVDSRAVRAKARVLVKPDRTVYLRVDCVVNARAGARGGTDAERARDGLMRLMTDLTALRCVMRGAPPSAAVAAELARECVATSCTFDADSVAPGAASFVARAPVHAVRFADPEMGLQCAFVTAAACEDHALSTFHDDAPADGGACAAPALSLRGASSSSSSSSSPSPSLSPPSPPPRRRGRPALPDAPRHHGVVRCHMMLRAGDVVPYSASRADDADDARASGARFGMQQALYAWDDDECGLVRGVMVSRIPADARFMVGATGETAAALVASGAADTRFVDKVRGTMMSVFRA